MRKYGLFMIGAAVAVLGMAAGPAPAQTYLSPSAVVASPDGATLYVAESGANQVAAVNAADGAVAKTVALSAAPHALALTADGAKLFVAAGAENGKILVVDPAAGAVTAEFAAGHTPSAIVVSADGATLYVCNRFSNAVGVYDAATGAAKASIPMKREPYAAALSPDGAKLVVANQLPYGASDGDYTAAYVAIVDTATNAVAAELQLPNGSTDLKGVCISPDGAFAYVTHLLSRYQLPTTQLERGWMNTNALSIIALASNAYVNTVLLDSVDLGAANPWAAACTADGALLCVTHAGTHEISAIDRAALHAKLDRVVAGEKVTEVSATPGDVPNDLSFLVDVRRRLKLTGNGPRAVALVGHTAYAAMYFSDSLCAVGLDPAPRVVCNVLALGPEQPENQLRTGEKFFFDADLCFQHWQSCGSCHPDARVDGLNWDLLNDGIGNPKNTKNMLLAHRTPPAMSLGVRESSEYAVRSGIKFIQFAVRPEEDAVAIDEYLKSLTPVPSPALVNGALGEAAQRGQAVFEKAGCAACHPAPLFTDLKQYNVGTGRGREEGQDFDTPTLVELWRTAPYLHDGRAATLRDVLKTFNEGDKHGTTSTLTDADVDDLVAYLSSL